MTHPLIGTWISEKNPRAHLTFHEDRRLTGSDGANAIVSTWADDGSITPETPQSGPSRDGSARIMPSFSTLMAAPNMQPWVTRARTVSVHGDEIRVFDHSDEQVGVLVRDSDSQ